MAPRTVLLTGLFLLAVLNPAPAQTPTPTRTIDFRPSGWIDMLDLLVVAEDWMEEVTPVIGDFNGNQRFDGEDLTVFLGGWRANHSETTRQPTVTATATPTPIQDLPDLVVTGMSIELETGASCDYESTQLGVRVGIGNEGVADSGPFSVEVNGSQQRITGGLAANQGASLWFPGYVWPGDNAAYVDCLFEINETNEENNEQISFLPIPTLPPPCSPTSTPTETTSNLPPYIISIPPEQGRVGETYAYHVEAVDPEGADILFSLPLAPGGMTISATGSITWVPSPQQLGSASVEVQISDGVHLETEGWTVAVSEWTSEASVFVDNTQGATVEVTNPSSVLFGTQVALPGGALAADATVTISSATGDDFFLGGIVVHFDGWEMVTGVVEIQVPVSQAVLEDTRPDAPLALYVHDASSGEWIVITDVEFIPAPSKGGKGIGASVGWLRGKIEAAAQDVARMVVDMTVAFKHEFVRVGEALFDVVDTGWNFWFQDEEFVVCRGSEGSFWSGGTDTRNLLIVHGILSDARTFADTDFKYPDEIVHALWDCYDNILIWQYRSARPIGAEPDLIEREFWLRSGNLLWKQFADHYSEKSLKKLAPKGYKSTSGVNSGIPLPTLKSLGWDFHCDIIAHSMGGLVVRDMLEKQPLIAYGTSADDLVDNLVTLGTPHDGALWTNFSDFFDAVLKALLRVSTPESIQIALGTLAPGALDLIDEYYGPSTDFIDYINQDRPTELSTAYWQAAGNWLFKDYDGWVTVDSALLNATSENSNICEGFGHYDLHQEFGNPSFAEGEGAGNWVVEKLGLDCHDIPTSIQMVTLPAGSFLMGNTGAARDQYCWCSGCDCEEPRHQVNINYSFQMGKYEVTNAQYAEVLNWAKGRGYLRNSSGGTYNGGDIYHSGHELLEIEYDIAYSGGDFIPETRGNRQMDSHPVMGVSWYGCVAFCNWLSEENGLNPCYDLTSWSLVNPDSGGYRLPSEAEWEYACRGSSSNPNRYAPFSFGDDLSVTDLWPCQYSALFNQYMVWCGNEGGWTEPVGSKLPNDYGLYDMHGNTWEWCQDWWHETYSDAPADGSAWESPVGSSRVFRGGDWGVPGGGPWPSRSAYRVCGIPSQGYGAGFRVVLPVSP